MNTKMVWIGTDTDCATPGRTYTVIGKFVADKHLKTYAYVFKNNKGQEDSAMSFLFATPKRR